ncbi:hypothetical protein C0W35_18330 [Photobacterium kishitanii]|uniref:hypothetical protein n=1 Tax=Photobacterium kishitanii TaxID=318456 RepID=UPI000D170D28|nr:hypothetical protein [Photobacterium kishitanii]PSU23847.1 hypothetical protein CTM84_02765 [Photobacterium kishitanii]PSU89961.1 hypothetical protein C0W35_18330 [Photobacterium kishitanii]PSW63703.1 hypothetical protein C0W54_03615 [Photobacterium kishitanii]
MDPLFLILLDVFKTEKVIASTFGLERASHFKKKVPEKIALLCHLSEDIPYIYNPSNYGRHRKGLKLNLETTKKVMTNDSIK